jgi:hypothetical protein
MQEDNPEKLFKCEQNGCNQGYKQAGGLAYHIERSHIGVKRATTPHPKSTRPEEKPYACPEHMCGKRYKSANGLLYHKEKRHTAPPEPKKNASFICNGETTGPDKPGLSLTFVVVLSRVPCGLRRVQQIGLAL